ncbi:MULTISPECIES: hypothetical protein [Fervidobacterium]|uniref:Uncharacterized protein n=1 Tax=Fervidobacterium nodosum (strain ATCC 35602 / DSM 5306 / Rt17-B1) TaxID=381764 RepID=A7HNY6_FERNB|nr:MULTISPECIES: hypothetical protein [Fervidobacterium]ABS61619.1 hypothetical protein Fnod_1786 [Fervidobacterium nodosum Rt17-B1]KAF2961840.1 hypothetical protein AS161_07005 [Fervidobacterium sp. 2310opik-2]PHJ14236.1 hypothetical protein IM41_02120 [Fervidobacterium sp. SC_NGM5_G05]HOJ94002.1 hypothetical protein [Fervidobacterium nodosum]
MTLVRAKQREVILEKESSFISTFFKYLIPIVLLVILALSAYILNWRTVQLSKELSIYRENLSIIEQQSEVLGLQITKIVMGRDVIN